jgi:DNA-binding MarR family transcriptional regulator
LRRATRLLTRYYEKELAAADLTPPQFELLSRLSARNGMAQCDLAEELGVDQTTLSRNIAVLIGRNWIIRAASPKDQRQVVYKVTPTGRSVWRKALPHWQRAQTQMQETLGSEWSTVWSVIDRLTGVTPR